MLNRLAKLLLVSTSLAPVLLTWAFGDYVNRGFRTDQMWAVAVAAGLTILCVLILVAARHQLPLITMETRSVKTADAEIIGFVIAYLLPLLSTSADIDGRLLVFALLLIVFVVWTTHSYHFNPLLTFFGYHFYEIQSSGGVTFLLLTRRDLVSTSDVRQVVQLTNYILLDLGGETLHE